MGHFTSKAKTTPLFLIHTEGLNLLPCMNPQPFKMQPQKSCPKLYPFYLFAITKEYKHIEIIYKMQYSLLTHPACYEPMFYYATTPLFMPSQGLEMPFYLIELQNQCNYQFLPQNVQLFDCLSTPNDPPQILPFSPHIIQLEKEIGTQLPTQNGKECSQSSERIQKKNDCVIQYNRIKGQRQIMATLSKSGNDRFIKKNTESNVVNQIFSFLWTPEKSKEFLIKILKEARKVDAFYQLMRAIKANCKSQLSRLYLKQLMSQEEWESGFKKLKKKLKKMQDISLEEASNAIKKSVFYYLREINRFSIMTSKKMNPKLWKLHFSKCREILTFLFEEQQS